VQAGGKDYLRQFLWSRVVSRNPLRHGYVAGTESQLGAAAQLQARP
jgi:RHH-type proline utilization regulon transcriptional repressor/proline dehydrogenase/delta 1-pyrroline-5-carboxylate dehydrogenase